MYVFCVMCNEPACLCDPDNMRTSSAFTTIGLHNHSVHLKSPIFPLDCYCSYCEKKQDFLSTKECIIIVYIYRSSIH